MESASELDILCYSL